MNVLVTADPAVSLARWLYRDGDLALTRKAARAAEVQGWVRPPGMRARAAPRRWSPDEDALVLARGSSQAELAARLGRTERSVNTRAWRLRDGLGSPHAGG
jgi:hypothetical protein